MTTSPTLSDETDNDGVLLQFLRDLHAHLPEDQRPMSWSAFSDEQIARAQVAWATAKASILAAAGEQPESKLSKPAQVGGGTFQAGVPERHVIEAAQRHYENQEAERNRTPEQRADDERKRRTLWDMINGVAGEQPADQVVMRPMESDDGRKGWYVDHPEFFCDLEHDAAGKWSVFFRDKTGNDAYGEQPTLEPVAGWKWMTHPDRFDGKPFPVRIYIVDGETYYQPFDETATDFEWGLRDKEWKEASPPPGKMEPASRPVQAGSGEAVAWRTKVQLAVGDFEPAMWIWAYTEFQTDKAEPLFAAPQPAVPQGWKLVPIEPTREMVQAGVDALSNYVDAAQVYSEMLAAAPDHQEPKA